MTLSYVLAIDVGNSRIKAGLIAESLDVGGLPSCAASCALPVSHPNPAEALSDWLATQRVQPERAFVGGVNPQVISSITATQSLGEHCRLSHVERPSAALLVNQTQQPERVGPDRLFDAVAANRIRPKGRSAVIIDSGTATTVDLVDAAGAFRGGAIIAGFELVAAALHERTALLPKIDIAALETPDPLGRDTSAALRSGLYWSLVGGVKELVAQLSAIAFEQDGEAPVVLLTGGASPILSSHMPAAQFHPYLTLQGIALSGR